MNRLPTEEFIRMALRTALYDRFGRSAAELGLNLGAITIHEGTIHEGTIRESPAAGAGNWSIAIAIRPPYQADAQQVLAAVQRQYPIIASKRTLRVV